MVARDKTGIFSQSEFSGLLMGHSYVVDGARCAAQRGRVQTQARMTKMTTSFVGGCCCAPCRTRPALRRPSSRFERARTPGGQRRRAKGRPSAIARAGARDPGARVSRRRADSSHRDCLACGRSGDRAIRHSGFSRPLRMRSNNAGPTRRPRRRAPHNEDPEPEAGPVKGPPAPIAERLERRWLRRIVGRLMGLLVT